MIKMYKAEVLGKLPVVQHFYFGKLLPFPEGADLEDDEAVGEDEHGHIHPKGETGWTMDCCGIPGKLSKVVIILDVVLTPFHSAVPSVFAAAAAAKGEGASSQGLLQPRSGLKPIPFD
jgi:serine/threonine-protein phosphatase 2A activator